MAMIRQRFRTNLNCGRCVEKVAPGLSADTAIESWAVDTSDPRKILTVAGDTDLSDRVHAVLAAAGFAVLGAVDESADDRSLVSLQANRLDASTVPLDRGPATVAATPPRLPSAFGRWLATYRPLLLVVGYLLLVVGTVEINAGNFVYERAMANFMGGFFLAFSFFKLLDLPGFVVAFRDYDLVARRLAWYGWCYPFVELALGVATLGHWNVVVVHSVTMVVMLVGLVGILQALRARRPVRCACLGTVFNLPMTTVTVVENSVMAVMALTMLLRSGH